MPAERFVIREPVDLLAVVPFALGFEPEESVVLVTVGATDLHARVDLPRGPDQVHEVVETLLRAVRANGVQTAAVVVYTDDAAAGRECAVALRDGLTAAGVRVLDCLRVAGERWWCADDPDDTGRPLDLRAHPFTAQRVFAGEAVRPSRDALAQWVRGEPDPDVDQALSLRPAADPRTAGLEVAWMRGLLDSYDGVGPLRAEQVARILALVQVGALRDHAWCGLTRDRARELLPLWREVTVRAPDDVRASAAALLGFCAWLAGDGALAWIAVERARSTEPGHTLAALVADLLEAAVSPARWEPVDLDAVTPAPLDGGAMG